MFVVVLLKVKKYDGGLNILPVFAMAKEFRN
jgi:hypothetical protein